MFKYLWLRLDFNGQRLEVLFWGPNVLLSFKLFQKSLILIM